MGDPDTALKSEIERREALTLSAYAGKNGITGLAVPATILHTSKMPVLGSGKIDYQAVKTLVEKQQAKAA